MDEPLIINKHRENKSIYILSILNYVLLTIICGFTYIGYTTMLQSMNFMLKNTYAMCNMTHVLTSAPAVCYDR